MNEASVSNCDTFSVQFCVVYLRRGCTGGSLPTDWEVRMVNLLTSFAVSHGRQTYLVPTGTRVKGVTNYENAFKQDVS